MGQYLILLYSRLWIIVNRTFIRTRLSTIILKSRPIQCVHNGAISQATQKKGQELFRMWCASAKTPIAFKCMRWPVAQWLAHQLKTSTGWFRSQSITNFSIWIFGAGMSHHLPTSIVWSLRSFGNNLKKRCFQVYDGKIWYDYGFQAAEFNNEARLAILLKSS